MEFIKLGKTDLKISPIGLGCWQFSAAKGFSRFFWPALPQKVITEIVRISLEGGINWFDTAEVYGNGNSERALAQALQSLNIKEDEVLIATKWFPIFRFASSLKKSFPKRQEALAPYPVTLHQIHMPLSFSAIEKQIEKMAELILENKIKAIGVSNFSASQMEKSAKTLERFNLSLASNQVQYNLLDRKIEKNGVLKCAKQLGVTILAYSPLAQGLLTGKFHENPELLKKLKSARRFMKYFNPKSLQLTNPLITSLKKIALQYNASTAEIALSWLILKNKGQVAAIAGASKTEHARLNTKSLSINLSLEEIDEIDQQSKKINFS